MLAQPLRPTLVRATALLLALIAQLLLLNPQAIAQTNHNVLLIIGDDIGVDMLGVYAKAGASPAPTPKLNQLAESGIRFTNAWANPLCAATRATIQTGRYGFRTQVLDFGSTALSQQEFSIGRTLHRDPSNNYDLALFGKWGLTAGYSNWIPDPIQMGYDYFNGSLNAIISGAQYFNYNDLDNNGNSDPNRKSLAFDSANCDKHDPIPLSKSSPCILSNSIPTSQAYATTQNVDDAIAWINTPRNGKPWFVTLSFNAPHAPFHVPPVTTRPDGSSTTNLGASFQCDNMVSSGAILTNKQRCYRAMIEVMDAEIDRLLANVNLSNTTVIFVGDNGTAEGMSTYYQASRSKATLYEGGINVPLIIAGADVVKSRTSSALINTTDLFMTILDLAGINHSKLPTTIPDANYDKPWEHDSVSLMPIIQDPCTNNICAIQSLRQFVYAEVYYETVGKTIRDTTGYKLIATVAGGWEFYDLQNDPLETSNLVSPTTGELLQANAVQQSALIRLQRWLGDPPPSTLRSQDMYPLPKFSSVTRAYKPSVSKVLLR